jgi:DNA-binding transcriptional LysR family regulator
MNWEDLRYFLAIASAGTLSGAARQLDVDQATISRRLAALEAELGTRLVNRLPRRAELTSLGQEVLEQAQAVEDRMFSIKRLAMTAHSELRAKITISAPPILARHFLAPHLLTLSQGMPQVQISVLSEPHFASLSRLEADLAMRLAPGVAESDIIKKIGQMEFALYTTMAYPNIATPEHWEFIGYTAHELSFDHKTWLYQIIADRRVICEVADLSNQYEAACSGIGVAGLPCFLADSDPRLVKLQTTEPMLNLSIWLALHPDRRNDRRVRDTTAALIGLVQALGLE